ncbi:MAG TPA: isochorismatase family cysteine hydrolase [Thermoleophilia bacterium]|nr:isochorismatase family cysteine hydrolase [Thermoleophilia bacterium]
MVYDLEHKQVALLVIDVQREYFDPDGPAYVEHARDIVANVNRLVDAFRAEDLPLVFVRHAHPPDGSDAGRMGDFSAPDEEDSFVEGTPRVEFIPELHVEPGDVVVTKRRYSAFLGTDLEAVLRTARVRAVVICGLMTSFCCETTARDAHGRDYEVLFAADAVEGPDLEDAEGRPVPHDQVLAGTVTALRAGFAEVVSTEELLRRLG